LLRRLGERKDIALTVVWNEMVEEIVEEDDHHPSKYFDRRRDLSDRD
jgi:hypothetical protein